MRRELSVLFLALICALGGTCADEGHPDVGEFRELKEFTADQRFVDPETELIDMDKVTKQAI